MANRTRRERFCLCTLQPRAWGRNRTRCRPGCPDPKGVKGNVENIKHMEVLAAAEDGWKIEKGKDGKK